MTPSPADLRKLAARCDDFWYAPGETELRVIAAALRFQAAEIEREAYRVQQQERERREPKPLHVVEDMIRWLDSRHGRGATKP